MISYHLNSLICFSQKKRHQLIIPNTCIGLDPYQLFFSFMSFSLDQKKKSSNKLTNLNHYSLSTWMRSNCVKPGASHAELIQPPDRSDHIYSFVRFRFLYLKLTSRLGCSHGNFRYYEKWMQVGSSGLCHC